MLFSLHSSQIHYGAIYWLFVLQHSNEILALKINFLAPCKTVCQIATILKKSNFLTFFWLLCQQSRKAPVCRLTVCGGGSPRRQSTSFMCSRLWLEMFRVRFPCRCVACAVSCCLLWEASFCGSCCHTVQLMVFTLLEQNPSLARTEKWQLGQERTAERRIQCEKAIRRYSMLINNR